MFKRAQGESGASATGKRTGRRPIKLFTEENELYEYSVAAILKHMRTVAELKRFLRRRVEPGASGAALIDAVIERLKARNYISDARYAAAYSTQRKEGRRLGSRRVAQDLIHKGIHPDVVKSEVETAYQGTHEETQARAFLAKKRIGKPAKDDERAKARVCRQLARAGFSPRIAFHILRNWDVAAE